MVTQSLVPTTILNGSRKGVYNVLATCARRKRVRYIEIPLMIIANLLDITSM